MHTRLLRILFAVATIGTSTAQQMVLSDTGNLNPEVLSSGARAWLLGPTTPTDEIANCLPHLDAEIAALPDVRIVVALGKIGFDAYLQLLKRRGVIVKPRPAFGHGVVHGLANGRMLVGCYHPSRQNTQTGRLTEAMLDSVFRQARRLLQQDGSRDQI